MSEYDNLRTDITVTMHGEAIQSVSGSGFKEAEIRHPNVVLELTKDIDNGMVNVDAYLGVDWQQFFGAEEEYTMFYGKAFYPNWPDVEMAFDFSKEAVIKAAKQRAIEDSTEVAYVLGDWAYQARKADHIASGEAGIFTECFNHYRQQNGYLEAPGANCDERGGGRYDQ